MLESRRDVFVEGLRIKVPELFPVEIPAEEIQPGQPLLAGELQVLHEFRRTHAEVQVDVRVHEREAFAETLVSTRRTG